VAQTKEMMALSLNGEILANHKACLVAGNECVQHAVKVGELLTKVKGYISHGEFGGYVEQYFPFSERHAQRFMQLYKDLKALPKATRLSVLDSAESVQGLRKLLPAPPPKPPTQPEGVDQDEAQDAEPLPWSGPRIGEEPADQDDPLDIPDGPALCPNCQGSNYDSDNDGMFCADCKEPIEDPAATAASVVLDSLDRPVPEHLRESHAQSAAIASQARRLDPILRDLMQLAEQIGGEFIPRASIENEVKSLKGRILGACYAFECPRCKGEVGKSCKACGGRGWWPMDKRGKLSAADKEYLGVE